MLEKFPSEKDVGVTKDFKLKSRDHIETTLYENKHVCDYLSMYETMLLRNVVPFATGQCN